ncbi:hypothetical protein SCHPADRAFT_266936 [Schizopora paradoxa]|uniref:Uncharacterized protein n=1 Tax=Schizopora paradoxa TaxID=27342 RepID=A0A0H2RU96_9AGAM|nr:hypothetical protein SCHPADRAFT_266936 [Schizopora paradoxa]
MPCHAVSKTESNAYLERWGSPSPCVWPMCDRRCLDVELERRCCRPRTYWQSPTLSWLLKRPSQFPPRQSPRNFCRVHQTRSLADAVSSNPWFSSTKSIKQGDIHLSKWLNDEFVHGVSGYRHHRARLESFFLPLHHGSKTIAFQVLRRSPTRGPPGIGERAWVEKQDL